MPRQGEEFHRLVEILERAVVDHPNVTVESPKYLMDKVTGEPREHEGRDERRDQDGERGDRRLRRQSRACDALLAHPAEGTAPQREASRGRCEPPRLGTCKRRGRSVGGLRVRGWSRRRARWHGW